MKTTDLQALGLTEMNKAEMQSVDGGFWQAILWGIAVYLVISSIEYPESFMKGFSNN